MILLQFKLHVPTLTLGAVFHMQFILFSLSWPLIWATQHTKGKGGKPKHSSPPRNPRKNKTLVSRFDAKYA